VRKTKILRKNSAISALSILLILT
jgi:hypothetical protein